MKATAEKKSRRSSNEALWASRQEEILAAATKLFAEYGYTDTDTQLLADKLKDVGVKAEVVVMEGEGHGWQGEKLRQSVDKMFAFFDEQLKK